jgi:uncharacterized membrane protein
MNLPAPIAEPPRRRQALGVWLRNSFAAGVAIVLPFAVTFWLIWSFVRFVDSQVTPLLPYELQPYANAIPGAGVVIAVVLITLIGALAANLIGRMVVTAGETLLKRVPLVRSIYGGSKQVFNQIASPDRTSFKEAVLVEYPNPGIWTIGFVTTDAVDPSLAALGEDIVAIYIPFAPIPTSGFLLYTPRANVKSTGMGPDEALKRVISLGLIKADETSKLR